LIKNLRSRNEGVDIEQLFLEYRTDRSYPVIVDQDLFNQSLEELIAEEKIISAEDDNQVYGNTSALIKSSVQQVNNEEAKQRLVHYIRTEFFNGDYQVFGYDELTDDPELKYMLILKNSNNQAKLQETLEEELYQGRDYKNNIVLYSSNQDVFKEENLEKMKLVLGIERAQEKINWEQSKIGRILEKRKDNLNQQLEELFGEYLYWETVEGKLELATAELEGCLSSEELIEELEIDKTELKADIIERLKELEGITSENLLTYYKKFRDYPLLTREDKFYQAVSELKEEKKVLAEEGGRLHLSPLIAAGKKAEDFAVEDVKERIVSLLKEDVLEENYRVYGYDQIEDNSRLEYLLLLDNFSNQEKLEQFLEEEIYQGLKFKNSLLVIRAQKEIFTEDILKQAKELLAIETIIADNKNLDYTEELLLNNKIDLIDKLTAKFGYYEKWISSDEGLILEEEQVELADLPNRIEVGLTEIKEHLIKELRSRNVGVDVEQLFLEYRTDRSYPVILDQDLFNKGLEELIAEEKVISAENDNQVYGNTSALIKSSVQQIDSQAAKERLLLYIRDEFFNGDYQVFGYEDVADNPDLKFMLVLKGFKEEAKLQETLEEELYQGRDYKNNIVLYSSYEDIFKEEYMEKMKLVVGIERAQEKINWEQNKIGRILEKRKDSLNQQLEELFGEYLYWETVEGKLELRAAELEGCLGREELITELEVDQAELKADIIERLKELEGITSEELLAYYKKFRDYPLITNEDKFYQAVSELKEEKKVLAEEGDRLHLSPLVAVGTRAEEFALEDVKERIASLLKEDVLEEEYKVYGYDQLSDDSDVDYVLLLETPEQDLRLFLEEEIYQELEFKNSLIVIRAQEEIFSEVIVNETKELLAAEILISENKNLDYTEELLLTTKEDLIDKLTPKFGYYEKWISSDEGLILEEEQVELADLSNRIEVGLTEIKEHLMNNLRNRNLGVDVEQLFLEYRTDRSYPVIIDQELFKQGLEELIAEDKIINAEDDNQVYGNTSALIKSSVQQIDNQEAKQRLVLYIRNEFFNGDYQVFGYDDLDDTPAIKYLLLLGSFKSRSKLEKTLENKLYQGREYQNNIVLYSSHEDVFKAEYVKIIKLILGIERAQEKINWDQSKIGRILNKRKDSLNRKLKVLFGDYLYWQTEEGKLELRAAELEGCLGREELIEEITTDLTELKADIIERLKELEGITSEELLAYYKKFRDYPLITNEDKFYQAVAELKEEEKVLAEEGDRLHLSPLIAVGTRAEDFALEDVKERIVSLLKDNLLTPDYKIYGYDDFEDSRELQYLLLLDDFSDHEKLVQFLEGEVYQDLEFENSILVIRAKDELFTEGIIEKTNKLLAAEKLIQQNKILNYSESKLSSLKEDLLNSVTTKFGYYENWSSSNEDLILKEEEIELADIPGNLEADFEVVKNHLTDNLRNRRVGVNIEDLFLDYRKQRGYPVIVERDLFYQSLEDLIAEEKIINAEAENQVYGNTSALIKSSVQEIDKQKVKERITLYVRDEIFNGDYQILGYDDIADSPELKYVVLLDKNNESAKLREDLEERLYQGREYKNNIVLYSSYENIFNQKYINKMKLVLGIEQAQEKINWEQNKIGRILDMRKERLDQELTSTFGEYLYWEQDSTELKLKSLDVEGCLGREELKSEIEISLSELKEKITSSLAELAGSTEEELLEKYKKSRRHPEIIDQEKFYQAIEQLKAEQEVICEDGKLYNDVESVIKAKTNTITNQKAREELIGYLKQKLLGDKYQIYNYDEIPDDSELKQVILLNYFEEKSKLEEFIVNNVLADREYKGNLVVITPREDINCYLDLMKEILTIKKLEFDNQLLERKREKLTKKLKEAFGYYLNWSEEESEIKLSLIEIDLEDVEDVVETDRSKLKEYVVKQVKEKLKLSELLAQLKEQLLTPLLSAEEILYEIIDNLQQQEELLLTKNGSEVSSITTEKDKGEIVLNNVELVADDEETKDDEETSEVQEETTAENIKPEEAESESKQQDDE
ncbi:MAG: hypothetical protein ACQERJ_01625, partial [Bacillota bacterium]